MNLLWLFLAFLSGAVPFSLLVGYKALRVDIRAFGDKNPGSSNVWRAGGRGWAVVALLLDFLKGAVPVGIANYVLDIDGFPLATIALAPIAGHAFSPFLGWRGGKALAVSFGTWSGLSLWLVPSIWGVLLAIWLLLLMPEGWAVMIGLLTLLPALILLQSPATWVLVWLGMAGLLAWTHQADLRRSPRWRCSVRHKQG